MRLKKFRRFSSTWSESRNSIYKLLSDFKKQECGVHVDTTCSDHTNRHAVLILSGVQSPGRPTDLRHRKRSDRHRAVFFPSVASVCNKNPQRLPPRKHNVTHVKMWQLKKTKQKRSSFQPDRTSRRRRSAACQKCESLCIH